MVIYINIFVQELRVTWERAYQLHAMASKDSRPKTRAPLEIKLLDFLYGGWGAGCFGFPIFRSNM